MGIERFPDIRTNTRPGTNRLVYKNRFFLFSLNFIAYFYYLQSKCLGLIQ